MAKNNDTITITQNRYINNLLKIGKQNAEPDNRAFRDFYNQEYLRKNYTVGKIRVACAADCVQITASTLRVFYVLCDSFIHNGREYNAENFISEYITACPQSQSRQNIPKIKKNIAAQLQILSKLALYLPKDNKIEPHVIGKINKPELYTTEKAKKIQTANEIINGFDFADTFKAYLSTARTHIKIPKSLLQINAKHNPHALTLILNILIVKDIKKHTKQPWRNLTPATLITYCPNLTEYQRAKRKNAGGYGKNDIMKPIIETLRSCADSYFHHAFIDTDDKKIDDVLNLSFNEWQQTRLQVQAITAKSTPTEEHKMQSKEGTMQSKSVQNVRTKDVQMRTKDVQMRTKDVQTSNQRSPENR